MSETRERYRARASQLTDGTQSEKSFAAQVVQLARLHGWMVYFTWRSVHSPAGFPDLCIVRPATYPVTLRLLGQTIWAKPELVVEALTVQMGPQPRLLFAELKSLGGRVSEAQQGWIDALRAAGVPCYIWRPTPECWVEIETVLGTREG